MRLYASVAKAAEYSADVELLRPFGASPAKVIFAASSELFGLYDAGTIIYFPNYTLVVDYHYGVARMWAVPAMVYIARNRFVGKTRFLAARLGVPARAAIAGHSRVAAAIRRILLARGWVRGRAEANALSRINRPTRGTINGRSESYSVVLFVKSLGSVHVYGNTRLSYRAPTARSGSANARGLSEAFGRLSIWKNITQQIFAGSKANVAAYVERRTAARALGVSRVSAIPRRITGVTWTSAGRTNLYTGPVLTIVTMTAVAEGKAKFYSTAEILGLSNLVTDPINAPIIDPQGSFLSFP